MADTPTQPSALTQSPAGSNSQPPRRRFKRRWILLFFVGTLLAMFLIDLPNEIARWHLAEAMESAKDGNLPRAITYADKADAWSPLAQTALERAGWRIELDQRDAAYADIEAAAQLAPEDINVSFRRVQLLMDCGRPKESADLAGQLREKYAGWGAGLQATLLNAEAYALAVAEQDLSRALELGEESLGMFVAPRTAAPRSPSLLERLFVWLDPPDQNAQLVQQRKVAATVYDTVGYLYYLQGDYAAARADLDVAVHYGELNYRDSLRNFQEARQFSVDPNEYADELKIENHTLAVMLYHRGLALEALGLEDEAAADFRRIRMELNETPGKDLY